MLGSKGKHFNKDQERWKRKTSTESDARGTLRGGIGGHCPKSDTMHTILDLDLWYTSSISSGIQQSERFHNVSSVRAVSGLWSSPGQCFSFRYLTFYTVVKGSNDVEALSVFFYFLPNYLSLDQV